VEDKGKGAYEEEYLYFWPNAIENVEGKYTPSNGKRDLSVLMMDKFYDFLTTSLSQISLNIAAAQPKSI